MLRVNQSISSFYGSSLALKAGYRGASGIGHGVVSEGHGILGFG